ncbi:transposase [Streptomyces longwoodensis]|uniref:transposase n=1 Tax=Streptomyces longwoodensis TaxID=68231 RepID=UPI003F54248F
MLDAVRLEPSADLAAVTADQVRDVVQPLADAGWRKGEPEVLVVLDAGYDAPRIAHLLADLPVEVPGRLRSDRVMRKPVPVPWICPPQGGRPPKHGGEFVFGDRVTWAEVTAVTVTNASRYEAATAQAWDRLHPQLARRAAWGGAGPRPPAGHRGTVWLTVERLPSGGLTGPSGCGGPVQVPPHRTSTGAGSPSCGASMWSTPFDCSSRPSAGPGPSSVTRRPPTAGHGSSWPPTPSSALPAPSRAISAVRGRGRRNRRDSPLHESAAGSETCARRPARQPVQPNPPAPAPAGRPTQRIGGQLPATTLDASLPPARRMPAPHITASAPNPAEQADKRHRGSAH